MDAITIAGSILGSLCIVLSNVFALFLSLRPSDSAGSSASSTYCDKDGEAIATATKYYFGNGWSRKSIVVASLIGLPLSLTPAILATLQSIRGEQTPSSASVLLLALVWCQFAGWVLSSLQSVLLFTKGSFTRRFQFAHCAFWTSVGCVLFAACGITAWRPESDLVFFSLHVAIAFVAAIRCICSVLVPRRPNVYFKGQEVDRENTVSLWGKLTFSYVAPLVYSTGRRQGETVADDLPQLPWRARSENLHDRLETSKQQGESLYHALVGAHTRDLVLQATLAVGYAVVGFGPQIALYGILTSLERNSRSSAGYWVAVLSITMFLSSSLASWLWCVTYARLAIPVYSELVALIYSKGLRRKDIQQPKSSNDDEDSESSGQQDAFNLASIDSKRISECVSYQHLVPSSITQFIIGCGLLLRLIGWQSLLPGLVSNLLASPVNFFIAKYFAAFQAGLMQARDHRTAVVHEVLNSIRQVKYSSLESAWETRILEARQREVSLSFKSILYESGFQATWTLAPLLLSAVSLTTYSLLHGGLEASIAFTSISIFGSLEVALSALPHLFAAWYQSKISIERIDEYLTQPDKASVDSSSDGTIVLQDASFTWPVGEKSEPASFKLSTLTLQFPPHGLTVIAGPTGCGKSMLLSALLGECDLISGSIRVPSNNSKSQRERLLNHDGEWSVDANAIAFVPQNPWTENGTIRDNILFGLPMEKTRYEKVLFASSLVKDLEILEDGDQTDIGANGVNLSGGQRARVSLARALYSRAGIIIMDDIFSALDTDTSQHVWEHGVTGALALNRTRILATHHIGLCLPRTDYCVVLSNGSVSSAGTVKELRGKEDFIKHTVDAGDGEDEADPQEKSDQLEGQDVARDVKTSQKFSPDEQRQTGSIPLKLYGTFISSDKSPWAWSFGILAALLFAALILVRSWWLSVWTEADAASSASRSHTTVTYLLQRYHAVRVSGDLAMYIGVYVALSLFAALMGTLRFFFVRMASLRSSQVLFKRLLSAVLRAPLRWVDTVPLGRILNRFTSDIYTLDFQLGSDIADLLLWSLQVLAILLASVSISPYILIPAACLLAGSLTLAAIYLRAARELKRLESISRSPILEQLSSSLVGLTTIRAFDRTREYTNTMFARIDDYAKVSWHLWLFNWWLQLRINLLGALFSTIVGALVVHLDIPAPLAGFAISFLLLYSHSLSSMIRFFSNFEMDMNATERVVDYAQITRESEDGADPPAAWPSSGRLSVDNLSVRYSSELPLVLKGLTFQAEHNQRIGVVGRTGSGKSTLGLALFRFIEAASGSIFVDGLDVSKLKLHALRKALAIVPQHPILFTGTIRSNLDPIGLFTDMELFDALERVYLISNEDRHNREHLFSLDRAVAEGGRNFSQGQRQLICLARAILQRPKIMILDEATSAVDMATDKLIQTAIRAEFGHNMSTLLVIAHRLSTIADFDRIIVMEDGKIVASGTPKELMQGPSGAFRELVNQSGERAQVEDTILGHHHG